MTKSLTQKKIDAFHREGFSFPITVLGTKEVTSIRRAMEGTVGDFKGPLAHLYHHKLHLIFKWADQLVHHPAILDAVEDVLGPNLLCWTSNLLIKDAQDPSFVSWHQDSGYWGLEPPEVVTAWVALSLSTSKSGCMQVVPKTHIGPDIPHRDTFDKDNMLTRGQELLTTYAEDDGVHLTLEPGQMSLHHIKLVHGSGKNRSDQKRIGFAIRYMSSEVRKSGAKESAMLVRGQRTNDSFAPELRPQVDFGLEGQLSHNRALRRQVENNYAPQGKLSLRNQWQLTRKKMLSQAGLDLLYCKLKVQKHLDDSGLFQS